MSQLPGGISRHGRRFRVEIRSGGEKLKRTFDELEDAVAYRDEILARRDRSRRPIARSLDTLTVRDVVDVWFNGPPEHPELGHRTRLGPRAARDYGEIIARDLRTVADLNVLDLLADNRPLKVLLTSAVTAHTAKKVHTILNQAFRAAMLADLGLTHHIPGNPVLGIKLRKAPSGAKDVPEPWEVEKIIIAASDEDERWGLYVRLTATLGTRRAETCALAASDFDVRQRRVHIRHTVQLGADGPVIGPPKSGSPRSLVIPADGFWKRMHPVLEAATTDYLFVGFSRTGDRSTAVKCWHPSYAGHRFLRTVRRLDLRGRDTGRHYGLHNLRHFVATMLYNRPPEDGGRDWVQLAYFLGHRDISMTMNLYANHVVRPGQEALGRSAAEMWWSADDRPR